MTEKHSERLPEKKAKELTQADKDKILDNLWVGHTDFASGITKPMPEPTKAEKVKEASKAEEPKGMFKK